MAFEQAMVRVRDWEVGGATKFVAFGISSLVTPAITFFCFIFFFFFFRLISKLSFVWV
jgi:hypothetical protein